MDFQQNPIDWRIKMNGQKTRKYVHREKRQQAQSKIKILMLSLLVFFSVLLFLLFLAKPQLELIGGTEIKLNINDTYIDPGIKLENKDNPLNKSEYQRTGYLNMKKAGTYYLEYTHIFFGLKTTICREIIVQQTQSPLPRIVINGDVDTTLLLGTPYEEDGAQVVGENSELIQNKLEISGTVNINLPGNYKIFYKVIDSSGRTVQEERNILVVSGTIYLTFDDGPNDTITPQILQILKEEQIKATFFVTGMGSDTILRQIYEQGHSIGLHTFTHDYATIYSSAQAYFEDLNRISERVKRITGQETKPILFPGGSSNAISNSYQPGIMSTLVHEVTKEGYQYFDWNVSSGDGGQQISDEEPYNSVISSLMTGQDNVVLMHDTKQTSANALKRIIHNGKERGFIFKPLNMNSFSAHHT